MGYIALAVAVLANFTANIALKRAVQQASGEQLGPQIASILGSAAFWVGLASAMVLLLAYLAAIRTLPLSVSYATITALTIALLTAWGFWSGSETVSLARIAGVIAIIAGLVLVLGPD